MEIERDGSTVTVKPRTRMGAPSSVDFRITVPAAMAIEINGVYADVTVQGTRGDVSVETVRGDVSGEDVKAKVPASGSKTSIESIATPASSPPTTTTRPSYSAVAV